MRISTLAEISGVPVPTIKFYIRAGLLAAGRPTARNQAEYGEEHVTRLRLIRILTGPGRLSLAAVQRILEALDSTGMVPGERCRATIWALFPDASDERGAGVDRARVIVDDFVDRLGWSVDADSPGRSALTQVLAALHRLGIACDAEVFRPYAEAAERMIAAEPVRLPAPTAEAAVARTVLLGVAFESMRLLASEHRMLNDPPAAKPQAAKAS
ncbi:MerR family transcriptional regulator [Actinoplanes teichomyceticus]|uniref:MerR-like DNA binding protein n=1 Tax=Actinoplanes teichomyceticus TaxID=1867 RepID=A0A561WBT5_ACTTI|nr:MerR family transcriptional regulator [Actinoplanes teichomyceticus]TWG21328.1 MerR-like DNA binding protein [Actinoplanes teichomyceticus]GIF16413.1 MerR family transcriptional regulator [Actinoplanes teichomyceticus]